MEGEELMRRLADVRAKLASTNAALETIEAENAELRGKLAAKADLGRQYLLNKMDRFAINNEKASTESQPYLAAHDVGLQSDARIESLLEGIDCLDPISESEWKSLRNKIDKIAFSDANDEHGGVHPRLRELIPSLLALPPENSRRYTIRHDEPIDSKAFTTTPDFSVLIASSTLSVESAADCVFHIEAKKHSAMERAILKALGHLCRKLIDCIDLVSGDRKLFGFCVGVDGDFMWLGRIDVDLASNEVTFRHTQPLPLWETNAEVETIGCRLIRTLLSCSPDALGHGPWVTLTEESKSFQLVSVLGRGGFAIVFKAKLINEDGTMDYVALKQLNKPTDNKEIELLKNFSSCDNLPTLCFQDWSSPALLPTQPVGVPLLHYARKLPVTQRLSADFLQALLNDLRTAAQYALREAGVCHRDIRPQNVVVVPGNDNEKCRFVLIDWGLAAPEGDPMHECFGGLAFFDDEIVEHTLRKRTGPLPFESKYDLSSILYVAYVAARSDDVEWANFRVVLISERKKYFQEWKNKLGFVTLNRMIDEWFLTATEPAMSRKLS